MSLSENGRKLKEYISSFSERWFDAGWLKNVEYYIWELAEFLPEHVGTIDMALRIYESNLIVEKGYEFGIWLYWDDKENKVKEITIEDWIIAYRS